MIERIRARPWSIHAFAVLILAVGLHTLITSLAHLDDWLFDFANALPQLPWNRDWVIVALSARFTIVCIPVAAIWIWRAGFARTLVTLFTFLACASLIRVLAEGSDPPDAMGVAKTLIIAGANALLFTPSANQWLRRDEAPSGVEAFE
ncbi:MAG: hypothetical protein QNI87_08405 [Erythrobacter sp.]|uniref:hypothetical protein n=1 Tax=Erythrobacter sp. TaxID=1042 RepID=UPI00262ECB41|nr:hypothetical protein [Erythrobacter sp.]MDJ0978545.1 hypothetical protein [Erythrobacter sp.]